MNHNIDEINATMCKKSLRHFVREFWDTVVPNELVWSNHMDVVCDEYQRVLERVFVRQPKENDIIFNVPPGTSKTMIISVMGTAWSFARMPSIRLFVGSYSKSAVSSIADNIKIVMTSEKYKNHFPDVLIRYDRNTLHEFKTTVNGHFYAFTVGGTLTSKHADAIIVDDPLNPKKALSTVEIQTANNVFDHTIPTRKVDKKVTPTILVMQRLSVNDPTGHLLAKNKNIRHVCLPAELSNDVNPPEYKSIYVDGLLDPNRLDAGIVFEMKMNLGSYNYAGQFAQRPAPFGGQIWQQWFVPIDDDKFPNSRLMTKYGTDWDLAYTDDEDNAANAYVTAGKIDEFIYIDDIGWDWLEFPQLIKWMNNFPSPHYIEAKASGKSAKQTLIKSGIPAIEVKPSSGDKVARARSVTPMVEAGMVFIRRSLIDRLYNDSKQGILQFPKSQWKDLADALAQSLHRLRKKGKISSGTSDGNSTPKPETRGNKSMVDML